MWRRFLKLFGVIPLSQKDYAEKAMRLKNRGSLPPEVRVKYKLVSGKTFRSHFHTK